MLVDLVNFKYFFLIIVLIIDIVFIINIDILNINKLFFDTVINNERKMNNTNSITKNSFLFFILVVV